MEKQLGKEGKITWKLGVRRGLLGSGCIYIWREISGFLGTLSCPWVRIYGHNGEPTAKTWNITSRTGLTKGFIGIVIQFAQVVI